MAAARKSRSSYNRKSYENNRKEILRKARANYRKKRSKILMRQKKYRIKTKAGTSAYKPLYMRGARGGRRPLYARLPRLNAYTFGLRKRGKNSKALGRNAPSFKKTARRKPRAGGRAFS